MVLWYHRTTTTTTNTSKNSNSNAAAVAQQQKIPHRTFSFKNVLLQNHHKSGSLDILYVVNAMAKTTKLLFRIWKVMLYAGAMILCELKVYLNTVHFWSNLFFSCVWVCVCMHVPFSEREETNKNNKKNGEQKWNANWQKKWVRIRATETSVTWNSFYWCWWRAFVRMVDVDKTQAHTFNRCMPMQKTDTKRFVSNRISMTQRIWCSSNSKSTSTS